MRPMTSRYRWLLVLDVAAITIFILLGVFAPLHAVWFIFAALWAAVAIRRAVLEARGNRLDR